MSSRARFAIQGLVCTALLLSPTRARSYDYLEHSYFTDRACLDAQDHLVERFRSGRGSTGAAGERERARYLALAIACPSRQSLEPYCVGSYKQAEGYLNRLKRKSVEGGGLAVSLGDFSGLADHLYEFGPVRGLPKAENRGLLGDVFRWISEDPGGAGGIAGSIGGASCGTDDGIVPWASVETSVRAELAAQERAGGWVEIPSKFLFTLARTRVPRGPRDPAGVYSFKNPQFLDMVLRGGHHFGEHAYGTWQGFHSVGVDLSDRPCSQVLGLDADALEDIADGLPEFEKIDWDDLPETEMRRRGCELLGERVKARLKQWALSAPVERSSPLKSELDRLTPAFVDRVTVALMGLVFEGAGLHFLQDVLAGGHIRAIQVNRSLSDRRYDHDIDNQEGVTALFRTATSEHAFVAYGDSYLLGPDFPGAPSDCSWSVLGQASPEAVSACLIRHQRGVLVATSSASLVDWALGGYMYGDHEPPCVAGGKDQDERFVCRSLPLESPRFAGVEGRAATEVSGTAKTAAPKLSRMLPGALPILPPRYAHESLAVNEAFDPVGRGNQLGLDATFYSNLGARAGWLTSHRIGLRLLNGEGDRNRFSVDYAYGFHWRWAARVLIDGEPFGFFGVKNIGAVRDFYAGIGPRLGVTVLPEGWVKIPLELSLSFRMPLTLYSTRLGFGTAAFEIEAAWVQFGIGLAFL